MQTKTLNRLTNCVLFEINAPIWNGGSKAVGLNATRLGKHNEIRFTYRRKSDGELSMPDAYYFDGELLSQIDYPKVNRKGVTLVIVPFTDLKRLERA